MADDLSDIRQDIRDRMVDTPLADIDDQLAQEGIRLAEDVWDRKTILEWSTPDFADWHLTDATERDEASLSLGEHRNHIRDEGRATYETWQAAQQAGNQALADRMQKRAAGLLWAVNETGRLIGRLGSTPLGRPVPLSQMDVVNAVVGLGSYRPIVEAHGTGMRKLKDDVADSGTLTAFFEDDFMELQHVHREIETKLYAGGSAPTDATDQDVRDAIENGSHNPDGDGDGY